MNLSFEHYFPRVTDGKSPRTWQRTLADDNECVDRMIHAGTGMGKTLGVGSAWAFNRLVRGDDSWPRRLVWCLPMRVLVEQTRDELQSLLDATQRVKKHDARVSVLMGGVESTDWHLYPERTEILVGTQDMLLSRALNRGYASARAKWPMEFALLNQDALWVFDEVQLQGVGAVTGAQLQAFRGQEAAGDRTVRPVRTWWMSATLRSNWLKTVDSAEVVAAANRHKIAVPREDQTAPVYTARKPVRVEAITEKKKEKAFASSMAELVTQEHNAAQPTNHGRVTLVVMNTVDEATLVFDRLRKELSDSETDLRLIHSRFRGREKQDWRQADAAMLSREACEDRKTDRIIVSTQVVEAGVDISASCLITELAPWSSLVQRFGRAARYGGQANVVVVDRGKSGKDALPYDEDDLAASLEALGRVRDVGLVELDKLEKQTLTDADFDARLFRFDYKNQLQRYDVDELFDTSAELTGEDTDISRFIREGDNVNVDLCWFTPGETEDGKLFSPPPEFQPSRDDLCSAPVTAAREWLTAKGKLAKHRERCDSSPAIFHWSFDEGAWLAVRSGRPVQPGRTLLIDHRVGGYSVDLGFTGAAPKKNETVGSPVRFDAPAESSDERGKDGLANASASGDWVSRTQDHYQSIGEHGGEVAASATKILSALTDNERLNELIDMAARLHDYGKSHPVFRGNIVVSDNAWKDRDDIAKAPHDAWRHPRDSRFNWPERSGCLRFEELNYGQRTGFRHELASMLGVMEIFRRIGHPAIASESDTSDEAMLEPIDAGFAKSLKRLSSDEVDLLLYLIASHHGKVRSGLHMTEHDQDFVIQSQRVAQYVPHEETNVTLVADIGTLVAAEAMPVRGVRTGDQLPSVSITLRNEQEVTLPAVKLDTDIAAMGWSDKFGRSWCERTTRLQQNHGPFQLALLEAVLRAADVRISRGEST